MTSILHGKEMIVESAQLSMANKLALMFWGSPGIGKSSMVAQAALELGIGFKPVIAHLFTPQDIKGYPYLNKETMKMEFAEPGVFPDVRRDGERGLFFLDELPNCVPALMSAWSIIILDRTTHDYVFPPGWLIVCAGNNQTDRAGTSRLTAPLENRLSHVTIKPSLSEFTSYAIMRGFHPAIIAYLERFPDKLSQFDPKSPDKAFPSPRSWERINEIMHMLAVPYEAIDVDAKGDVVVTSRAVEKLYDWIGGTIGGGATVEFMAYLSLWRDMPPLSAILDGSYDVTKLADRPDLYAGVVTSVLVWALDAPNQEKINTAMNVVVRMMTSKKSREYPMLLLLKLWGTPPAQKGMTSPAQLVLASPHWRTLAPDFQQYTKPSASGGMAKPPSLRKT